MYRPLACSSSGSHTLKKRPRSDLKVRRWIGRRTPSWRIFLSKLTARLFPLRQHPPRKQPREPSLAGRVNGCAVLRSAPALRVTHPARYSITGSYQPARGAGSGGLARLVGLWGGQCGHGVPGLGRDGRGRNRQIWRAPNGGRAVEPAAYESASSLTGPGSAGFILSLTWIPTVGVHRSRRPTGSARPQYPLN